MTRDLGKANDTMNSHLETGIYRLVNTEDGDLAMFYCGDDLYRKVVSIDRLNVQMFTNSRSCLLGWDRPSATTIESLVVPHWKHLEALIYINIYQLR